mmetsp:Transcript_4527/g.13030  ORF Transcript_4527/g.13030 Transcript_4527/m.13030 type:complete len:80 (+) Transcript_4527:51-290(+)
MRCNAMNPNYVSYNIISFTKSINQREDLQRSWCSEQQGPIDMSSLIPARQALAHCHWHIVIGTVLPSHTVADGVGWLHC